MIVCNVYEYTFQMIPHTFGHLDWYRPTPVADGLLALGLDRVRHNVLTSTSSERQPYVIMNPSLSVYNVYTNMDLSVRVPEHQRLAFS